MRIVDTTGAVPARPGLHFRRAKLADAPAVSACVEAAYTPWIGRIGRKPWPMLHDYSAVIQTHHVVIAERDGAVVGVLVLAETSEGFVIENVAVIPARQREGIGSTLLAHGEQEARARGHTSVYLYTNEKMSENIALYVKAGYVEYERRQEVGFCRVFLRKQLP